MTQFYSFDKLGLQDENYPTGPHTENWHGPPKWESFHLGDCQFSGDVSFGSSQFGDNTEGGFLAKILHQSALPDRQQNPQGRFNLKKKNQDPDTWQKLFSIKRR